MDTSDTVLLTRGVLFLCAALQLSFEWLYFGSWYWLPKNSPKKLIGWALLLASILALPLAYPNVARGVHRDDTSVAILFVDGIAVISILFYKLKRGKPSNRES
jgi:hypothetical protein